MTGPDPRAPGGCWRTAGHGPGGARERERGAVVCSQAVPRWGFGRHHGTLHHPCILFAFATDDRMHGARTEPSHTAAATIHRDGGTTCARHRRSWRRWPRRLERGRPVPECKPTAGRRWPALGAALPTALPTAAPAAAPAAAAAATLHAGCCSCHAKQHCHPAQSNLLLSIGPRVRWRCSASVVQGPGLQTRPFAGANGGLRRVSVDGGASYTFQSYGLFCR